MDNVIDTFVKTEEVISVKEFLELNKNNKKAIKETKIVPPNKLHRYGAVKVVYKTPKFVAYVQ